MRLLAALFGAFLILLTPSPVDAAPPAPRTVQLTRTVGVDITVPASCGSPTGPVACRPGR
ncbi:hypothetical protein DLJ47_24530 [Micromonospora sp. S4605]|uniref:hypothetical protein n=1 Tax=Micromonospora sp. S4605 TaxID=1420897 RepID=UPI000D6F9B55|nr:hypothetical protein [Micromonospora sp. S4605]PWU50186.1 hypothetical protein DLJ47_24530 [Micromonospora sp. S4605]